MIGSKKKSGNKQYIIVGAGRFGTSVAQTLRDAGQEVFIIDSDIDKVQQLSEEFENVAVIDATDEYSLDRIGINNFDVAIIATGTNLKASIMGTLLAQEAGIPMIISKAGDKLHKKVLQKIGASHIISPEIDMGEKLGKKLAFRNIMDYMELNEEYSILNIKIPKKWVGKTLTQLDVRRRYDISITGIIRENGELKMPPDPDEPFEADVTLIAAGKNERLTRIAAKLQ